MALGFVLAASAAYAQTPARPNPSPGVRMQIGQRIRSGLKSGQLTRPELQQLRDRLGKIHKEARSMRQDGRQLTPDERAKLKRELRGASRMLFRMKHNRHHRRGK